MFFNSLTRALKHRSLGLLIIRIALGIVFIAHGWMKVQNMDMVNGMFTSMGLPMGTAMIIAWLEVIGGGALILGVLTRYIAFIFAIEMAAAVYFTGFFANGYAQHELEILLGLVSLGVALAGSGRFSIYAGACAHCGGMSCKGHDCKCDGDCHK